MNSIVDLHQAVLDLLSDKDWHTFAEVLGRLGDLIMPEQAVRFYMITNVKPGTPLGEQVRRGRRRGIYTALDNLKNRKDLEVKNPAEKVNSREFRLLDKSQAPVLPEPPKVKVKAKPRAKQKTKEAKNPEPEPITTIATVEVTDVLAAIDNAEKLFLVAFKESKDWRDFGFHCRSLRRIVIHNSVINHKP